MFNMHDITNVLKIVHFWANPQKYQSSIIVLTRCMPLQVLALAAVELSQPKEAESSDPALKEVRGRREGGSDQTPQAASRMQPTLMRKPWEDIIKERLKAKTRIISKVYALTLEPLY